MVALTRPICKKRGKEMHKRPDFSERSFGAILEKLVEETTVTEQRPDNARQAALDYHEFPKPGKLEIRATKPLANGRDLARAYSPGVAEACLEIKADPSTASRYTSRANLVGVALKPSRIDWKMFDQSVNLQQGCLNVGHKASMFLL